MINTESFVLGMSRPAQLGFQAAYSPIMEGIIDLHHYICFFLVAILVFVMWMLFYTVIAYGYKSNLYVKSEEDIRKDFYKHHPSIYPLGRFMRSIYDSYRDVVVVIKGFFSTFLGSVNYEHSRNLTHWTNLEIAWTIFPSFILLAIAIPSFILLYSMDELVDDVSITVKIVAHQWYWAYQLSNPTSVPYELDTPALAVKSFDSYMIPTDIHTVSGDAKYAAGIRLLQTDWPLYLPVQTHIRLLVTSADVLHSFAVPSFGIKIDAVPGRINQGFLYINEPGRFFGQCSEICGANHGFMPIEVIAVPWETWTEFFNNAFLNDGGSAKLPPSEMTDKN